MNLPAGLSLELLDRKHRRRKFASGHPSVDEWLAHKALAAMKKHTSTTRVLARADATVAGYYSLASTALDVSLVPDALFAGARPARPPPTLTLAWLGVDRTFAGRGLGTWLFARALADACQAYEFVRFAAVIVDALTEENEIFYRARGFSPVPGAPGKLFLPAQTLHAVVRAR